MLSGESYAAAGLGLVGVAMDEAGENGHGDNTEVKEKGPVLEVVKVILDALVNGGISAPAVDLRPAGDAHA